MYYVGRDGDSVKVDRQTEILIVGRFTVEGILEQSTVPNTRRRASPPKTRLMLWRCARRLTGRKRMARAEKLVTALLYTKNNDYLSWPIYTWNTVLFAQRVHLHFRRSNKYLGSSIFRHPNSFFLSLYLQRKGDKEPWAHSSFLILLDPKRNYGLNQKHLLSLKEKKNKTRVCCCCASTAVVYVWWGCQSQR